jgi:HEAT repeat protein
LRYGGKRLSEHLLLAAGNSGGSQRALQQIGTNSLPLLRTWWETDTPKWRVSIGTRLWNRGILSPAFPPMELRWAAFSAILALGVDALPLAPYLINQGTNTHNEFASRGIGVVAVQFQTLQHLQSVPASLDASLRLSLDNAIKTLEIQSTHDITFHSRLVLIRKLRLDLDPLFGLSSRNLEEQTNALRRLSRRDEYYTQANTILVAQLESTDARVAENAAICLGNYGRRATNAMTSLQKALAHPDEQVRTAASKALSRITHESL